MKNNRTNINRHQHQHHNRRHLGQILHDLSINLPADHLVPRQLLREVVQDLPA